MGLLSAFSVIFFMLSPLISIEHFVDGEAYSIVYMALTAWAVFNIRVDHDSAMIGVELLSMFAFVSRVV